MVDAREILKHSLIFSSLGKEDLDELARLAVERTVKSGESVFWEGDAPEYFYLVVSGRIKAVKQSSMGKQLIIGFFGHGEMFGEVAVFENRPYPASAQAAIDTNVLGIPAGKFLEFLPGHPRVVLSIISVLSGRLREAQTRLKEMSGERVEQRVARTLLQLHERLGSYLPFTRQEIAELTGTTTETAIRVISQLKERGITGSARGKIVILDELKLKVLAEGPPV